MPNSKTNRKKEKNKEQTQADEDHAEPCHFIQADELNFLRSLGDGHYGSVQMAEWIPKAGSHKYVAVKSLKNAGVDGVIKSMLTEVKILQTLQHAHIVQLYGISVTVGDEPFKLVTEYASLGSLHENLIQKNNTVCQVSALSTFAVQVADGMRYLASLQLVHRDLATRNILVFEPRLVKISDFGLARALEGDGARVITLRQKLAVAWLPPESIKQNIFTPASDVWSYGITLWEMFTLGKEPFSGAGTLQKIKDIVMKDPIKHLPKPLACSSGFYDVMLSCWKRVPNERPSFEDIYKRVAQFQFQEGVTTVTHCTAEEGHLSYHCKQKVTIISRCEDEMLLVQLDNGSIGKVAATNVDRKSKAVQRDLGGAQISRPYNIKKLDAKEIIPIETSRQTSLVPPGAKSKQNGSKLNKEPNPAHQPANTGEEDEDDTASLGQAYPDPYPKIAILGDYPKGYDLLEEPEPSSRPVEPTAGLSAPNAVEGGTERVGAFDDHDCTHLSVTGIKSLSIGQPVPVRNYEYTSMEPGVGPAVFTSEVPINGHTYNVIDDVLGQGAFMKNNGYVSMGNESSSSVRDRTQSESDVCRENVAEDGYDVLIWGISSSKDDSLVYPSRTLQSPRPKRNAPPIPDRSDLNGRSNFRADRASTISHGGRRRGPVPLPRMKMRASSRTTSPSQLITNDSHLDNDSTKGSVSEGASAQALKGSLVPLVTEERPKDGIPNNIDRHAGITAVEVTSRSAQAGQAENPKFGNFINLSSNGSGEEEKESASPPELPPKLGSYSESNYQTLIYNPRPHPETDPSVLNQHPPPSGETSRDRGTNPNVSNDRQLAGSTQDTYGDEINRKIQEIQVVCPDLSKDHCYSALLDCQGDLEETLTLLKPIQLHKVTGKDVEACRRALKHCGGSMERAANFLIDLE